MTSIAMDIHNRELPPAKSMPKPADWDYKNKEMQILKKDLQIICDEEREASREKTARQVCLNSLISKKKNINLIFSNL